MECTRYCLPVKGLIMQKSIKKNMIMNIILTASNLLFPLITYSYAARILGTEGTGKIAFAQSIMQYFLYLATLGIPAYGLRECAKVRDDKDSLSHIVQELLIINLASAATAYLALTAAVLIVPKLLEYKKLLVLMSSGIFLNTIGLEWVYQALEEYSYITIRSIVFRLISVVLTFIFIRSSDDYVLYAFLNIFVLLAGNVCNFINVRKHISLKKKKPYNLKKHINPVFTLFAATAVITIYTNFDVSMIGFIRSENEVGLYNAALNFKIIIMSVSTTVTSVLIPGIAYNFQKKNLPELNRLIINSLRVSMILALPLAIFVFIFSEDILHFVCGNEFLSASVTLRVLMVCVIPLILTNLFGNQLLISLGDEKIYSQSVTVGLCVNIVLNYYLIPIFGAAGAAIATLITELWNVFWMGRGVKEYAVMLLKKINFLQYFIPLLTGSLAGLLMKNHLREVNVFWRLVLEASVVFGIYYGMLLSVKEPMISGQVSAAINKLKRLAEKFPLA